MSAPLKATALGRTETRGQFETGNCKFQVHLEKKERDQLLKVENDIQQQHVKNERRKKNFFSPTGLLLT